MFMRIGKKNTTTTTTTTKQQQQQQKQKQKQTIKQTKTYLHRTFESR